MLVTRTQWAWIRLAVAAVSLVVACIANSYASQSLALAEEALRAAEAGTK